MLFRFVVYNFMLFDKSILTLLSYWLYKESKMVNFDKMKIELKI